MQHHPNRYYLQVNSGSGAKFKVENPIIFFDGFCGICNRFVDAILRADKNNIFLFATLQGDLAKELDSLLSDAPDQMSVVYVDEQGIYHPSEAALPIISRLGGLWWIFSPGLLVPRQFRDPIYRFIARNRYSWFGRRDRCRLPNKSERNRFLD